MPTFHIDPTGAEPGSYTTMAAMDAAEATDLVTAAEVGTVRLHAGSDTSDIVTLDTDWVTNASFYLDFIPDQESDRNDGTRGTGYRMTSVTSQSGAAMVTVNTNAVRFEAFSTDCAHTRNGINFATSGEAHHRVYRSSLWGNAGTSSEGCQSLGGLNASSDVIVANVLFVNFGIAYSAFSGSESVYLYNCSAAQCDHTSKGVYDLDSTGSRTIDCRNCVVYAAATSVEYDASTGSHNQSEDATATGTNANINWDHTTPDAIVDPAHPGNHKWEAAYTGPGINDGKDLSADSIFAFSVDFFGTARPAGSWDRGWHQITAGGLTATAGIATAVAAVLNPSATGSGAATATAGQPTATAAGFGPTASPSAEAGLPAATAAVLDPSATGSGAAAATSGFPGAVAAVLDPTATGSGAAAATAGLPAAVAAALDATAQTTQVATAGLATATAAVLDPTATGTGAGTATAGQATASAAVLDPSATGSGAVSATAGLAAAVAAALDATGSTSLQATAGLATASATAFDATAANQAQEATAGLASAVAAALAPTATGSGAATATAGLATATATALAASGTAFKTLLEIDFEVELTPQVDFEVGFSTE